MAAAFSREERLKTKNAPQRRRERRRRARRAGCGAMLARGAVTKIREALRLAALRTGVSMTTEELRGASAPDWKASRPLERQDKNNCKSASRSAAATRTQPPS